MWAGVKLKLKMYREIIESLDRKRLVKICPGADCT
jgi:hypothetical protein